MSDAILDEELVQRLQEIAEREHRSVTEVVRTMVEKYDIEAPVYEPKHKSKYPDWLPRTADSPDYDPLDDLIGMIDGDITDASTTVRERWRNIIGKSMAILVDTSILLASVFPKDKYYVRAKELLQSLRGELQITPAPVLTELFHMTRIRMSYAWAIKVFATTQMSFQIEALTPEDMFRMQQIMLHYADSKLDFADTAIMAQAERLNITRIATFDHRDFEIFRPTHCDYLELLP